MAGPHQRQCIADLLLQLLAMGVRIVHHQDIQQFQVQPFEHLLKCGIAPENMDVDVNGMDRRERAKGSFVRDGFCRCTLRSGRLSGGGQGDRET